VLEKERLTLFIAETTSDPVQYFHKSLEIYHSFVFKVDEFEVWVWTLSFIFLHVSSLPHFLLNCNLQLKQSFITDLTFEQSKSMYKQIHKKILSLKRNAGISILKILSKFLMSKMTPIFRPITKTFFNILPCFLRLFTETTHMRMLICRQVR